MYNFKAKLSEIMRKLILSVALFFLSLIVCSQVAPFKYFIEFTDKNESPYSINRPEEFLSERSLQRRANQYIPVTEEDLPVNPSYVTQVANTGVTLITRSRWFNGITIYTTDASKLNVIASFPFVKKIVKNQGIINNYEPVEDKFRLEHSFSSIPSAEPKNLKSSPSGYNYGPSFRQIQMLNGNLLHEQGFRGQGKVIAVLDAGFLQVDRLKAFDSLWQNNQILGWRDFVNPGSNVFEEYIHGMMVLSVLAGNYPGYIIGTAPKADYWLLRSEQFDTEYLIEEYNWVCAAEFADSVGADIITSSLGYTTFDDPAMNHTCADMDGHTTLITRGANIAAQKGMAVINSVGNEGGNQGWRCVSAPADGDHVFGIGAVDADGLYAGFSSVGVVDGDRIKPNVAAMGRNAVVFWTNDSIVTASGTSFSCPIIAGLTACLWQARPNATPSRIYKTIEESCSHYASPDSLTGFGIPDFSRAMTLLSISEKSESISKVFPNPFTRNFTIRYHSSFSEKIKISIYDYTGLLVYEDKNITCRIGENQIQVQNLINFSRGIYLVRLQGDSFSTIFRVIKSNNL